MRLSSALCLLATLAAAATRPTDVSALAQHLSRDGSLLRSRKGAPVGARATTPGQVHALCEEVQDRLVNDLRAIEAAVNSTGLPWAGDMNEMNKHLMDQIEQTFALVGTIDDINRMVKSVADRAARLRNRGGFRGCIKGCDGLGRTAREDLR